MMMRDVDMNSENVIRQHESTRMNRKTKNIQDNGEMNENIRVKVLEKTTGPLYFAR